VKRRVPLPRQAHFVRRVLTPVWCSVILLLAGCPRTDSTGEDQSQRLLPQGTKLRLLVADDPALAAAAELLRGEWNAQTGSDFEVEQLSGGDLLDSDGLPPADAVICASHYLGSLAEQRRIVPLPEKLLEDDQGEWSEVFPLLRTKEVVWGTEVLAVPFGSPVLICYYRADLLEKLGRQPPKTWDEYYELAKLFADETRLGAAAPSGGAGWYGAIEPLGPGWAAQTLLARAAAYATHRENFSTLFNIDTMAPLIDGPPFVRALEELVATARLGPPEQTSYDPAAVRTAFWQGRCGLALSWPSRAGDDPVPAEAEIQAGFAEIPGSPDVYDVVDRQWETRREDEDWQVPLLGIAGRLGVVTNESRWPEAAFHLLLWLSDDDSDPPASSVSPATTLFRRSHLERPHLWAEKQVASATALRYAEITQQTLSRGQSMLTLGIPGRSEYLGALDEAVRRAVRGDQTPQESLSQTSTLWREITRRLGYDQQRGAYRRSLGLR